MKRFHNICFVSQGLADESSALKQALSIARDNNADLKALLVYPELPKEMIEYKEKHEASLIEQVKASIRVAREAISSGDASVPVDIELHNSTPFVIGYGKTSIHIEVENGGTDAQRIIRQVIRNSYDLVIKEAEPREGGKGFKSVDMDLLRMCPCPVFLSRPISRHRDEIRVAVAIDPESLTPESHDLSLRLLEVARTYADRCNGELNIISCWDYECEESLRHHPFLKVDSEEIDEIIRESFNQSQTALESLVAQAKISGKMRIHHIRGAADKMIPRTMEELGIDVLIMGTLARTGVAGFIIGNTAENIIQELRSSLLVLKPNGFVSPVKAY